MLIVKNVNLKKQATYGSLNENDWYLFGDFLGHEVLTFDFYGNQVATSAGSQAFRISAKANGNGPKFDLLQTTGGSPIFEVALEWDGSKNLIYFHTTNVSPNDINIDITVASESKVSTSGFNLLVTPVLQVPTTPFATYNLEAATSSGGRTGILSSGETGDINHQVGIPLNMFSVGEVQRFFPSGLFTIVSGTVLQATVDCTVVLTLQSHRVYGLGGNGAAFVIDKSPDNITWTKQAGNDFVFSNAVTSLTDSMTSFTFMASVNAGEFIRYNTITFNIGASSLCSRIQFYEK